jgi:predicted metal-dependent HD superfamily phosphohydrolase
MIKAPQIEDQQVLKQVLKNVKVYVKTFFAERQAVSLPYHNIKHTQYVVKTVKKMADHYKLNKKDVFVLEVAAWFHDIGMIDDPQNHEAAGAGLAFNFLTAENVNGQLIEQVRALIMVTQIPQFPSCLLEEIICDADLFYLGRKSFEKKNEQLQRELELEQKKGINKKEWLANTILFMEAHHYNTEYCLSLLGPVKAKNLAKLKQKLINTERDIVTAYEHFTEKLIADPEKDRPEKGIETMFRITSSNNQRLSDMADNKARLLITVNSIILSAIISLVLRKLDNYSFLVYPTFILLGICLVVMIFAILATRPSIPAGKFTIHDLEQKSVNLLFFGNFYKMPLQEYKDGMMRVMDDRIFLYNTLISDVYGQGVVLGKKYGLLRIAYNIFMFGLIISVLAFIAASAFHHDIPLIPIK